MKIVLQRVTQASVSIDRCTIGAIDRGIVLLVGIHHDDTEEMAISLARKCVDLRIFPDDDGKMNRCLEDIGGGILAISQFTLYGDCRKGRRPSWIDAAGPEKAEGLYDFFVAELRKICPTVATGSFGADMKVSLVNDGPVTLILEK